MVMKSALMVWGGWDGHTPQAATELLAPLLEARGFEVEIADSLDAYLDLESLLKRDLIVQCVTMAKISWEQSGNLQKAVQAGVGFAGWHGGIIDSFREDTGYQWMTGGQWVAHPGDCIPSYTVNITDPDHEITSGLGDFELKDTEQYYCHYDPGVHVLCSTTFSNSPTVPTGSGSTRSPPKSLPNNPIVPAYLQVPLLQLKGVLQTPAQQRSRKSPQPAATLKKYSSVYIRRKTSACAASPHRGCSIRLPKRSLVASTR